LGTGRVDVELESGSSLTIECGGCCE